jgi:hypothetical protein
MGFIFLLGSYCLVAITGSGMTIITTMMITMMMLYLLYFMFMDNLYC